jgi:hypothetical protein
MSMTEDADLLFRSSSGNKSVRHPKSILVSLTLGWCSSAPDELLHARGCCIEPRFVHRSR